MISVTGTTIPGCLSLEIPYHADDRGTLVKVFQRSAFAQLGLPEEFREQFHSRSDAGVVRGLHVQEPPSAHVKLVTCVYGDVYDVVVDLRIGSTYGLHVSFDLFGSEGRAIIVPVGCAHGFLSRRADSIVGYWTTGEHDPEHDGGVRWDSAGIDWPLSGRTPIVSVRDQGLPSIDAYASPFRLDG